jgi:hypothetical protein
MAELTVMGYQIYNFIAAAVIADPQLPIKIMGVVLVYAVIRLFGSALSINYNSRG